MKKQTEQYFDGLFIRYPALEVCRRDIAAAFDIMVACYRSDNKILACGNGGSASDAEHIVGELMKGFILKRKLPDCDREKLRTSGGADWQSLADSLQRALPAISLVSQSALISAVANDNGADMVYAQQVYGYGRPGDALIAISTSGNSNNVLYAAAVARTFGVATIGFTGEKGGKLLGLCDVTILAPAKEPFKVQEYHQPTYHALCAMVEMEMFA